jgi:hypothetical protein
MASPSVTYTFANNTAADATQVNTNFTDILNAMSDGTKDFSISALTCGGTATFNGNTTFGNASGDDVTFTASLASTIPIKTDATYDIGSTTKGLRSVYFGGNSQRVDIKASSSMSATWTLTLPTTAGTANYALVTNGSGVASWASVLNGTLNQYNVYIGNSSNAATSVNTNLLGDLKGTAGSFDFVDADVNTTNNTVSETTHGRTVGEKVYLTTTGVLPGGLSASTTYYIIVTDANTIKFATTYANARAGTAVDITSAAGGGTHTVNYGGWVFNSPATVYTNLAQPGFYAHKNGSDQTWNAAGDTPAKVTFGTQRWFQGASGDYASSTYTVPAAGLWMVSAQLTFEDTTTGGYEYRLFVYKNGSRVQESEISSPSASPSGREVSVPRIVIVDSYAASDTIEIYAESNRNHSVTAALIKGNDKQTFFNMVKIS